jgi:hypothetical protein
MNRRRHRHAQVQNEQRHCDGENAVAQRGEAIEVLAGDAVIKAAHPASYRERIERPRQKEETRC